MSLDDIEAERQRTEAVEAATNVIRDHLSNHLVSNPEATYTSWIAALHPENVTLDSRLLNTGNPWLEVWQEATGGGRNSSRCAVFRPASGAAPSGWGGLIDTTMGLLLTFFEVVLVIALETIRSAILWPAFLCGRLVRRLPHAFPDLESPWSACFSWPAVLFMQLMLILIMIAGCMWYIEKVLVLSVAYSTAGVCGLLALSPKQGLWTFEKIKKVVTRTHGAMHMIFPPSPIEADVPGEQPVSVAVPVSV